MAAFTREQRARLLDVLDLVGGQIEVLVGLLQKANMQFVALHNVLADKGVITPQEWDATLAHVEAGVAVDMALRPDPRRFREVVRELLEG
jgi:hypothetical protein